MNLGFTRLDYGGQVLKAGIWRSPYVRVFSVRNGQRVYEVSNYRRVRRDDGPHVYAADTEFIVTEPDLNFTAKAGYRMYQTLSGYYWEGYEADGSIVKESDLNYITKDRERFYESRAGMSYHKEGEKAVHYKGESLPGAYPLWVELPGIGLPEVTEVDLAFTKLRAVQDTDADLDGTTVRFKGNTAETRYVLGRK